MTGEIHLQKFDIWPVSVRVDYSPHHVDLAALTGGKYAELVNLVPWKVRNKNVQFQVILASFTHHRGTYAGY